MMELKRGNISEIQLNFSNISHPLTTRGYKLWRKTHRLARGMKAAFLCKSACPLLGICID